MSYVAISVMTERQLIVRGPFATFTDAKAYAETMSSDPEEALVVEVLPPVNLHISDTTDAQPL